MGVAALSVALAFASAWAAAHLVIGEWADGSDPVSSGRSMEGHLLAFGTAVPAFTVVVAAGVMLGLTGLGAREQWEGRLAFLAVVGFTMVGLAFTRL